MPPQLIQVIGPLRLMPYGPPSLGVQRPARTLHHRPDHKQRRLSSLATRRLYEGGSRSHLCGLDQYRISGLEPSERQIQSCCIFWSSGGATPHPADDARVRLPRPASSTARPKCNPPMPLSAPLPRCSSPDSVEVHRSLSPGPQRGN